MGALSQLVHNRRRHQKAVDDAQARLDQHQQDLEERQAILQDTVEQQQEIQRNKTEYEHLRQQLALLETDLKNAYERYQTSIEPDFLQQRELEFIEKKLTNLREERDEIMQKLKVEYNVRTKYNDESHKLHQTNNEYINNQSQMIDENRGELTKNDKELQYTERMVGVNDYNVNVMDRKLNIAITVLGFSAAGFIPTLFAFLNLIPTKLAVTAILILAVVAGAIVYVKFKKVDNRSKRIWELRNFEEPDDKKGGKVFGTIQEDPVQEEDDLQLEDILAAKLEDAEKCGISTK
tara:strand:+ start:99 stop:974 length:876 start_codon:yes stop_codon:yes gene_type:complete